MGKGKGKRPLFSLLSKSSKKKKPKSLGRRGPRDKPATLQSAEVIPVPEEMKPVLGDMIPSFRGYLLGFSNLPAHRALTEEDSRKVLKETLDVDKRRVLSRQKLFSNHPAITAVVRARSEVVELFKRRTYYGPQPGVRVFRLRNDHLDVANLSADQIEQDHYRQMSEFEAEINAVLVHYDSAVLALQQAWSTIMAQNEAELGSLFRAKYYPNIARLPIRLAHKFYPVSVQIPSEYRFASAEARQKLWDDSMARFFGGISREMDSVADAMLGQFTQMISSITAFHKGEAKTFKRTVVDRFFEQLDQMQEKFVKCGIPIDGNLKKFSKGVRRLLKADGLKPSALPDYLRESDSRRDAFLAQVAKLEPVLQACLERPKRRRVEVD